MHIFSTKSGRVGGVPCYPVHIKLYIYNKCEKNIQMMAEKHGSSKYIVV